MQENVYVIGQRSYFHNCSPVLFFWQDSISSVFFDCGVAGAAERIDIGVVKRSDVVGAAKNGVAGAAKNGVAGAAKSGGTAVAENCTVRAA